MFSKYIPNFLLLSNTEMFLFAISLIFTTAAGVTVFLLFSSRTFFRLKNGYQIRVPTIMPDGSEVTFKRDLKAHLDALERKLTKKACELKKSGEVVVDDNSKENLEKLADTQAKVKKYYMQLKEEIKNSEEEFAKIQGQIDSYRARRLELEKEMKRNEEYYNSLLRSVPKLPNSDVAILHESVDLPNDATVVAQRKLAKSETSEGDAKKPFNLGGKSVHLYSRITSKRQQNVEHSNSKSLLHTNKCSNSVAKLDSVKQLKDRFSAPINLCCCGSISCARNCVASKNLKLDLQSQHQIFQNIAPSCTENVGRTLGDKCAKALNSLKRTTGLYTEEKA